MSTETWQDDNSQYLAVSLEWLRLRLHRLVPLPATPEKPGIFASRRVQNGNAKNQAALEQQISQAEEERKKRANVEPPPALVSLGKLFGLSDFEQEILLLCAATELDPSVSNLCAQVSLNQGKAYPTFALALTLFDLPTWDALAATGPLRYLRLLEINQPGATPLTASALRVDERVLNYIKGLNQIDEHLLSFGAPVGLRPALSISQQTAAIAVRQRLPVDQYGQLQPTVVQCLVTDPDSGLAVAQAVCEDLNALPFRVVAADLPVTAAELESFARLWQRESRLFRLVLYVDAMQIEPASAEAAAVQRLLQKQAGLVFLGLREMPLRWDGHSIVMEIGKPSRTEQYDCWLAHVEPSLVEHVDAVGIARRLAGQFDLSLEQITQVGGQQLNAADQGAEKAAAHVSAQLWDSCRDLTRPRLDALAQRLEPKATWEDLVVSDEAARLLRQIAGQVRVRHQVYDQWGFSVKMNRGFGISALFAGDSGTGKTMAAEVIANDLQLNLYRIDLSAVVSKYIGETEKNLRKLFDAAEQGGAILFFDEADALFGKRSEVKDSHDRYANIEINYLLQRMEAFNGLAILATNMKSALDPAFMRRLRFIVNFPFPAAKERKRIWENVFPRAGGPLNIAGTPVEALNYDHLAKLNLAGGNIHNIALNAAFLAAQAESKVTMPLVLEAARTEFRKLEKSIKDEDFRVLEAVGKGA